MVIRALEKWLWAELPEPY